MATKNKAEDQTPEASTEKQLVRLPQHGMIAGVAAGFADYFSIDVTIMRLIFIIAAFATSGLGALVYLVLIVVVPVASESGAVAAASNGSDQINSRQRNNSPKLRQYAGFGLVLIGVWLFLTQLFPELRSLLSWSALYPLLLILVGVLILVRSRK